MLDVIVMIFTSWPVHIMHYNIGIQRRENRTRKSGQSWLW